MDRGDGDAALAELQAERPQEVITGGLGRHVGCEERRPGLGADRGDVDDVAGAPREHGGQEPERERGRPQVVHGGQALEVLGPVAGERAAQRDAGVADEHLDRSLLAPERFRELADRADVGKVRRAHLGPAAAPATLPGDPLELLAPARHQDEVATGGRGIEREGASDPRRGARDQDAPAAQRLSQPRPVALLRPRLPGVQHARTLSDAGRQRRAACLPSRP